MLDQLARRTILPTIALGLALAACSGGSADDDYYYYDDPEPTEEPASVDVTGDWNTQWGGTQSDMTLSQTGSDVSGSYELSTSYGYIEGTISGRTLTGTWSDDYGSGEIEFVFTSDGNSFSGTWSGGNSWTGTRVTDGGAPTGSYSESCSECEIDGGSICCYCTAISGWEAWTCLDLPCEASVSNCDGKLTCGECP